MSVITKANKPITVVIGFLGAEMRHVKKYASVISGLDLHLPSTVSPKLVKSQSDGTKETVLKVNSDTVLHLPHTLNILKPSSIDKSSRELSDKLISADGLYPNRPLFFYLLSNNGAYNFAHFLSTLRRESPEDFSRLSQNLKGIIWDSCPCDPTVEMFSRAYTTVLHAKWSKKPRPVHPLITPWMHPTFENIIGSPGNVTKRHLDDVNNGLNTLIPSSTNHLFLASRSDIIVPFEETLRYAQSKVSKVTSDLDTDASLSPNGDGGAQQSSQKETVNSSTLVDQPTVNKNLAQGAPVSHELGRNVWLHDFATSRHVEHLRTFPSAYTSIVKSFLERTLEKQK